MKQLKALNIRDERHLCKHLGTNPKELEKICRSPGKYYREGPRRIKNKIRYIATPRGCLRELLDKLQTLLQRIELPENLHGGIKGHSNITNALPHVRQAVLLKLDIKDFFPSVKSGRVYDVFCMYGCSPDVARYLTRLTTLKGAIPQGSPTSTILANIVLKPLTKRIANLAGQHNAIYTQYVDDITISGQDHIVRLIPIISKIVEQEGFHLNIRKTEILDARQEQTVTGVRIDHGIDAPSTKIKQTRQKIEKIIYSLGATIKKDAVSPSIIRGLHGHINYISQLNRGAARSLRNRLSQVTGSSKS